jgi:HAMP domain-containing protein
VQLPVVGVAAAAVAFVLIVFLGAMRRVGRPMSEIVTAAERVAGGDFSTRVTEHGPPRCAPSRTRSTA